MRTCNRCNNVVNDNEEFCSRCGGVKFTEISPFSAGGGMGGNQAESVQSNTMVNQQMMGRQMPGGVNINKNNTTGTPNHPNLMGNNVQTMSRQEHMNMHQGGSNMNVQMPQRGNDKGQQMTDQQIQEQLNQTAAPRSTGAKGIKGLLSKIFVTENDGSSTKEWLLTMLQLIIPIWNIIYFVKSWKEPTLPGYKRTYLKAFLVYFIAAAILSGLVSLIFGIVNAITVAIIMGY